jgi:hypothetical protein
VYDESEIDGLPELMRGRDGQITPQACVKGQWGTQVFPFHPAVGEHFVHKYVSSMRTKMLH